MTETQTTFADLGVEQRFVDRLADQGITHPFPIQQIVLQDALAGRDVLAKSPTGSGKTLAFAIPIMQRLTDDSPTPAALILVPTRELAAQVMDEFRMIAGSDLDITAVYGGVKYGGQEKAVRHARVIVATPGRLEDLADRGIVDLSGLEVLVLDEADRMLDMGFLPQVNAIVRRLPEDRHTMFFSATLDKRVGRMAQRLTNEPVQHEFEPEIDPDEIGNIEHRFIKVTRGSKLNTMLTELGSDRGLALVFCRTKRGVDDLLDEMAREGHEVVALHGDMPQSVRERTLANFDRGKVDILIATDVAARGLDLDDITHVVNYDPPDEATSYTHRVGRTGRAGRTGTAITLVLDDEQRKVGLLARRLGLTDQFAAAGLKMMAPRLLYRSRHRGLPPRRGGRR